MAAAPPPGPNRSVDLKAAAAGRAAGGAAGSGAGNGDGDVQTDGGVMAKPAQALATAAHGQILAPRSGLPPNVTSGLPPINPASFNRYAYVPHFHQQHYHNGSANIFNITNSHNVQIGRTNVMNIGLPRQQYYADSSSSDEEDQPLSIEDAKLEELRKCEREISNIELQDIAQHVGLGWRRLIRFLGMQDYDVDEVYEEYGSRGLEEVIYQLLKRWKCEIPNPTVAEMLYQVQRCDMYHLAQYLRGDDFQILT